MPFRSCALWGMLFIMLSTSAVWAQNPATPPESQVADDEEPVEPEKNDTEESRSYGEQRFRLSAKGSYSFKLINDAPDAENLFGGALALQATIVPEAIAVELEARGLESEGHLILPLELMLKWPPRLTEKLHFDVGIGLAFELEFLQEVEFDFGLSAGLGISYWFWPRFAVVADMNYGVIFKTEAAHELNLNAGVAVGF